MSITGRRKPLWVNLNTSDREHTKDGRVLAGDGRAGHWQNHLAQNVSPQFGAVTCTRTAAPLFLSFTAQD